MSAVPAEPEIAERFHPRRCTATSHRTGKRCGRYAIRGGTVCMSHGGALPQVRARAEERLKALQHPAIDRVERILTTSEDDNVALRAATAVLDRTGMGPSSTSTVNVNAEAQLAIVLQRLEEPARAILDIAEAPELPE